MTGINDGKFEIKKGQGISQAIAEEIGLTKEQCKKVDWKSVFQIVNEAKGKEGNNVNWDGGSDSFVPASQKYIVHEGDKFEFSQEMWKKITDVVSNSLNKTKQTKEFKADDLKFTFSDAKAQKESDRANQILTDVANKNPKLKVVDDDGIKIINLPNGEKIKIFQENGDGDVLMVLVFIKDEDGKKVRVAYTDEHAEVDKKDIKDNEYKTIENLSKDKNSIGRTGPLPKDYNWNAIQQVAKQILGMQ